MVNEEHKQQEEQDEMIKSPTTDTMVVRYKVEQVDKIQDSCELVDEVEDDISEVDEVLESDLET